MAEEKLARYMILTSHGAPEPKLPKPPKQPKASILTVQDGLPVIFGENTIPVCAVRVVHPTNPAASSVNHGVTMLYVPPHASLELHSHETEETYYILEGEGLFYLTEGTRPVERGHFIYLPSWCEHGIENTGTDMLVVLVTTSPTNP
jgi:mannose-6-phosphate isomerase-like protein (cupin superfamily)